MRVSIWQQFSSNHSADFTVVGQFVSPERAEQVAEELRHILQTIGAWWEQIGDWKAKAAVDQQLRRKGDLTPPEKMFQAKYGVGWTSYPGDNKSYPLDWATFQGAAEGVQVYRNVVFVSPPGNTWAGAKPFDAILKALGGGVASDVEDDDFIELVVTISFTAPDEATAEAFAQRGSKPINSRTSIISIPELGNATPGTIE